MITNEQILEESGILNDHILSKWLDQEFLSFQWFLLVTLVLICYILFFTLADKRRFSEILFFGSLVAVSVSVYYSIGTFFGYWALLVAVLPFYPDFFASDLTVIPLLAMMVYQYTHRWRSFILWYIIYSVGLIFGVYYLLFGALKIFIYMGLLIVFIDFIIFTTLGIIMRAIMVALKKKEAKSGNTDAQYALSKLIAQPNIRED